MRSASALSMFIASVVAHRPQVTTSGGAVLGNVLPDVNEFLGIRFGEATRRFEEPQDFHGRYGTSPLDASDFAPACMQVGDSANETYGSEDCLFANVWQPAGAKPHSNLPVMVFVNGGSNQFGEAEPYNGSALAARQGVVFCSITYRTGPIGWMAFKEDQAAGRASGTYGLLDIQSGLRWVQREIARFGGDPQRVLVHGQSSGAGLIELQLLLPGSRGLAQRLVSQSGGLYASDLASGAKTSRALGETFGCDPNALKACLQKLPAANITSQTYSFGWGPIVDGVVLPEDPMTMLVKGSINPMSVIFGAQTNDTGREMDPTPVNRSVYEASVLAQVGHEHLKDALKLYPATEDAKVNRNSLGRIGSDGNLCSIRRRAELLNTHRPHSAFMYRFNWFYKSNLGCTAEPNYHDPAMGSVHEDEVTFVFGQPIFMFEGACCGKWGDKLKSEPCAQTPECVSCWNPKLGDGYHAYFDDKEWSFSDLVGGYWATFAATGSPNAHHAGPWPTSGNGTEFTHNIVLDADLPEQHKVERTLYDTPEVCDFWDRVNAKAVIAV